MKARENDRIRTLVDVNTGFEDKTVPAGTEGTVVDAPAEGKPEVYYVDIGEDDGFDNISLTPDQFEVVS